MANSSILGGHVAPKRASGHDVDTLGPSDSSDSGSDVQGERAMATDGDDPDELGSVTARLSSDSDTEGTGERASASGERVNDGADIWPDRVRMDPSMASEDALVAGDLERIHVEDLAVDDEPTQDDEDDASEEGEGS
jgi:hypothetical protein